MQAALASVQGVEKVTVDYAGKTATVSCKTGCDAPALIAALQKKGYGGSVK